ncbi:MAG: glycosyltransferase family 4 protein [Clostridiales Family XIII bacterium]|jgi:glycosyltransferase involved in cell wall biosynthesis|nr:glycosyltransferase family 4 protein [Clostridiales Family XIII bacterium]
MNIAFIGNEESIHVVKFVNALLAKGHGVTLFTLSGSKTGNPQIAQGVRRCRLAGNSAASYYTAAWRLRRELQAGGFDVVNAHYASGYGTLARLAKASPLVLNAWGSDVYSFPYQSRLRRRIVCANLRYADKILSTSHAMKAHIHDLLGSADIDIGIVPFGVDLAKFRFHDRGAAARPDVHIGIVKALRPIYGIDVLLRAFRLLADAPGPMPFRLSIFGGGAQAAELQELSSGLGLSGLVHFGGHADNDKVPDILAGFDIFAAPSVVNESFGVALVEAMASGLPVVASDGDGFKEVVDDGSTGIIVPRGDHVRLAEALRSLAGDKALRLEMGLRGRQKAETYYSLDKNVDALIEAYRQACHKARRR